MKPPCQRCATERTVKNGFVQGRQRFKCKGCGFQFTLPGRRGRPPTEKALAVLLYLHGMSLAAIARMLRVSSPAVWKWVHAFLETLPAPAAARSNAAGRPALMTLEEVRVRLADASAGEASGRLVMVLPAPAASRDLGVMVGALVESSGSSRSEEAV